MTIPGRSQDDETLHFLSATLGSHMVLQRAPQQATLWGHTAPGATVTTTMARSTAYPARRHRDGDSDQAAIPQLPQVFHCTAGADGTWRQQLPAVHASTDAYTFTFASSNSTAERATIDDVLFGDVYICGGQSAACAASARSTSAVGCGLPRATRARARVRASWRALGRVSGQPRHSTA